MSLKTFLTRPVEQYEIDALAEFMATFQASQDFRFWTGLMVEEGRELREALLNESPEDQLKEIADLRYVTVGSALVKPQVLEGIIKDDDPVIANIKELDWISEWIFENHDDLFTVEQMEEAFSRVQDSNMSKVGDDGRPIRREDGKILKGPNYKAPDLTDLIQGAA